MRWVRFGLVVVLAIELAVWEAFLVPARPFGWPLPVAAALAVVGNLALGTAGARSLGSRWGAAIPGIVWLVVALTFGSGRSEGDRIVPDTVRGLAFLLLGTLAAAGVAGAAGAKPAPRATPDGPARR